MLIAHNDFANVIKLLLDFVMDFDIQGNFIDKTTILAMSCNVLEDKGANDKIPLNEFMALKAEYYMKILEIISEIKNQNVQ